MSFTIDIHTHILPEKLPDFAAKYGKGSYLSIEHHQPGCARLLKEGKVFREVKSNCWDPALRLKECDESAISVQVLSTVPVLFSYWAPPQAGLGISQFLNEHIAEVVSQAPTRFVGLATVPLQSPSDAIDEMERSYSDLGLAGVEIGTHVNGRNLGEQEFWPFWQAAEALGVPIFIHPWDMLGKERMDKYFLPWLVGMPAETTIAFCSLAFSGVWTRFPRLKIAFAHGGGNVPFTLGRINHGFVARPDLCSVDCKTPPQDLAGKFYVDSLVHDPRALRFLIEVLGIGSVAVGSDYPFPLGEQSPGALVKSLGLPRAEQDRLLHGTALEWLGVSRERFKT